MRPRYLYNCASLHFFTRNERDVSIEKFSPAKLRIGSRIHVLYDLKTYFPSFTCMVNGSFDKCCHWSFLVCMVSKLKCSMWGPKLDFNLLIAFVCVHTHACVFLNHEKWLNLSGRSQLLVNTICSHTSNLGSEKFAGICQCAHPSCNFIKLLKNKQ